MRIILTVNNLRLGQFITYSLFVLIFAQSISHGDASGIFQKGSSIQEGFRATTS